MTVASPIAWSDVQGAILWWLKDATGLEVAWAEQPRKPEDGAPMGLLKILSGPRPVHEDSTQKTWNAAEGLIERTTSGQREFTIQAQVFTDDVMPDGHALNYLARAQSALRMRRFIKRLKTDGDVAIVTIGQIQNLTAIAGADWRSRAAMDVVFRVASNVDAGSVPRIANAELTIKLRDGNDGEPIEVTSTATNE